MDGCVYLDESDRQMILLRTGRKAIPLSLSAVPLDKQFTFYDQVRLAYGLMADIASVQSSPIPLLVRSLIFYDSTEFCICSSTRDFLDH
eukprot:scaffold25495_cov30-Tisochrysis_lutea.AAC.4